MAAVLAVAGQALGFLGGIFSNPKDKERDEQTDRLKAAALSGNSAAYWQLKCLSGDTSETTRKNAIAAGVLSASEGPCGYATDHAKGYAKAAVAEVDLRRGVANVAGTVAGGAAQVGMTSAPDAFLGTVGAGVASQYSLSPLLIIGGVAVLVYLVAKRGR